MIVSILTDNYPGGHTRAEHGLSYLVEHEGIRLLFDTGQSNLFLENASIMGVDVGNVDMIVLSHGHFDHGNGLEYLPGGKLLCHPDCFIKRYRTSDHSSIGLKNSREEIAARFELMTSRDPHWISRRIVFLGEIPRVTDFESQKTSFSLEDGTPDFVMDDTGIALLMDEGLFVITGCGHAGVVNTLEHARKATGENRLYGVMGGFHLKKPDRQTKETIRYLQGNGVKHVLPSHCTAFPALVEFAGSFHLRQLKTGDVLAF